MPLLELLLNPMAGDNGNLIAIMFYIGLAMLAGVAMLERSFKQ